MSTLHNTGAAKAIEMQAAGAKPRGSARWGLDADLAARELPDEGIRGFKNVSRQRGRPPLYVLRGFQAFFNSMATMAGFQPAPGAKK